MIIVNTVLMGLGTVNIGFIKILATKHTELKRSHNLEFRIVAVSDSSGWAIQPLGLDYDDLIGLKKGKGKVNTLEQYNPEIDNENLVDFLDADLLIDSSPGNLIDGNPGLALSKAALQKGWSVVFANKAPLIFAFEELHALATTFGGEIAYSATVCGGLPVINVLQRDLKLASLTRLRGVFNATSNYILQELEKGGSLEDAIREAQRLGAAEADPTHDTHGHDTANKLLIIMKAFTNFEGTIHDILVEGIQDIKPEQLVAARERGHKIKLLASAEPQGTSWKLTVQPTEVDANSFLGSCNGWEMGIELTTDFYESVCMKNYEADPVGTSAAVLRDAIDVCLKKRLQ